MDKTQLRKQLEALAMFRRATDDTTHLEHMTVFLMCALYEGTSISHLRDQLEMPLNTVSKYIRRLVAGGEGVLKLEVDQADTRTKLVKLTKKGTKLANDLSKLYAS